MKWSIKGGGCQKIHGKIQGIGKNMVGGCFLAILEKCSVPSKDIFLTPPPVLFRTNKIVSSDTV